MNSRNELIGDVIRDLLAQIPAYQNVKDREIAKAFEISPAAYSNYKDNKRTPEPKTAQNMAKSWGAIRGLSEDSAEVMAAKERLVNSHSEEPRLFFPSLMRNEINLKISTLKLGLFQEFFEKVFTRYTDHVGLKVSRNERDCSEGLSDDFAEGNVHVALGFLDVVSRLLWARFVPLFPIRLSPSAIGLFPDAEADDPMSEVVRNLSEALSHRLERSSVRFQALVIAGGVGEHHCRHKLQMTPGQLESAHTLDPVALAVQLRRMNQSHGRPVLICDEYTCIRVLNELKTDGRLLFPLTTRENVRKIPVRQELPRYLAGLAVSRDQKDFWEFLQESIMNFVGREFHMITEEAAKLFERLQEEVSRATKYMYRWEPEAGHALEGRAIWKPVALLNDFDGLQLAGQYCRYVLHMDAQSVAAPSAETAPWLSLLHRTRQIVHRNDSQRKIYYYDAATHNSTTEVKIEALLRDLEVQYRTTTRASEEALDDIRKDANNLSEKYGSEHGRVLLAYEGRIADGAEARYVGLLCLTRENTQRRDSGADACQLRYLWVNPVVRGQKIGEALIAEGIRYAAQKLRVEKVYVEVMPDLEQAIGLFRQAGFKPDSHRSEYGDRWVFALSLPATPRR